MIRPRKETETFRPNSQCVSKAKNSSNLQRKIPALSFFSRTLRELQPGRSDARSFERLGRENSGVYMA